VTAVAVNNPPANRIASNFFIQIKFLEFEVVVEIGSIFANYAVTSTSIVQRRRTERKVSEVETRQISQFFRVDTGEILPALRSAKNALTVSTPTA
jgi:hypothetical protein